VTVVFTSVQNLLKIFEGVATLPSERFLKARLCFEECEHLWNRFWAGERRTVGCIYLKEKPGKFTE